MQTIGKNNGGKSIKIMRREKINIGLNISGLRIRNDLFKSKFINKSQQWLTTAPLFTGNVLKVRLSCVKPSEKEGEKISKKNYGKGKKKSRSG